MAARRVGEERFIDCVVRNTPIPLAGGDHGFKYRLAFMVEDPCVVRYANQAGKGNQRCRVEADGIDREVPHDSHSAQVLLDGFWRDVDEWREDA